MDSKAFFSFSDFLFPSNLINLQSTFSQKSKNRFNATIGNQKVKAQLKEKEAAKNQYNDAIASGATSFLVEKEADSSEEIFTISIGNLVAGSEATIEAEYKTEVQVESAGQLRFTLSSALLEAARLVSGTEEKNFEIDVLVDMSSSSSEIVYLSSPFEGAQVEEISNQQRRVRVQKKKEEQEEEFSIFIDLKEANVHEPRVVIEEFIDEKKKEGEETTAVMVSFTPELKKDLVSEIIFLVDRSGSMGGIRVSFWAFLIGI